MTTTEPTPLGPLGRCKYFSIDHYEMPDLCHDWKIQEPKGVEPGTTVEYHGTMGFRHGEARVIRLSRDPLSADDPLRSSDGWRYSLQQEEHVYPIVNVRRQSFTPIPEN